LMLALMLSHFVFLFLCELGERDIACGLMFKLELILLLLL